MAQAPPVRRRWLVLLSIAGCLSALAVAELVLRVAVSPPVRKRHIVPDPVLHHRLRPNVAATIEGVPYSTSSLGLRDREYAIPKPAGVFRIVMLGDSFTEGGGLELEATVAKQAESLLAARGCRGHEVVNAGLQSYSPILEYLALQHVGLRLEPDLVVLNFDMTDLHDDFVRTAIAHLDPAGLPVSVGADRRAEAAILLPPVTKPKALRFLDPVEHSLAGLLLYQNLRLSALGRRLLGPPNLDQDELEARGLIGLPAYDRLAIVRDEDFAALAPAWRLTARYIAGIRDLAERRGSRFVLVVYPHAAQVSAAESPGSRRRFGLRPGLFAGSERPFRVLEALGRRQRFPVVNLLGLFRERALTDGPLFRENDIHHTPAGARVFAEGIVAGLLAAEILPRCR